MDNDEYCEYKHWTKNGVLHRAWGLPAIEWINGSKQWWVNGKRHRENDLPAVDMANGLKQWYVNGKLHREPLTGALGVGRPAVETSANGHKYWYVNDRLHREPPLPAVEMANGDKEWWINGVCHREPPLPAYEGADGAKSWRVNGKRHRAGGLPAIERANGEKEWWLDGVQYYPDRWSRETMSPDMVGQTCVISLEPIQNDSEVCKCGVCNSLTLFSSMEEWLRANEICPYCRSPWTNWVKYVKP